MPSIIKLPQRRNPEGDTTPATRPENATSGGYTFFQHVLFLSVSFLLIFSMCATGRAGA